MADDLNVGTLSGRIELEDRLGPQVAEIANKLDLLNDKMSKTNSGAVAVAEGMIGAEVALKAAGLALDVVKDGLKELFDIAIEGSHAADIEDTFHRLTEQAGLTADTLKGKLSTALHGTVEDSDLMVRVNQNLAAGLKLTEDQAEVLAKGAFALAKATGGDAKEALDKLSDAMVTGRTRSIALLTGKIDLNDAEEKFAEKLGVSTDHLSAQGKQAAIQEVILTKVAEATGRIGDQQIRLADKVQQSSVQFANFEKDLGVAIASSPKIEQAFDDIKSAIVTAFGGDQADLIQTITEKVESLAETTVSATKTAISILQEAKQLYTDYFGVIEGGGAVLAAYYGSMLLATGGMKAYEATLAAVKVLTTEVTIGTAAAQAGLIGAAAALGAFVGFKIGSLQPVSDFFEGLALRVEGYSKAEVASMIATDHATQEATAKLDPLKQAHEAAAKAASDQAKALDETMKAHTGAAASANDHAAAEQNVGLTIGYTKEQMKLYQEAIKEMAFVTGDWRAVLETVSGDVVSAVKYYLDAGVALDKLAAAYGLTETQSKAIEKSWKEGNDTLKETLAALETLSKAWSDYYHGLRDMTASDVANAKNAALDKYEATVKSLSDAGDADTSHYDEAWDLYKKDVQKNQDSLVLKDQNSKAFIDKELSDSKDKYEFMLQHSDQYTAADIENQHKQVQALQATRNAWGQNGQAIEDNTDKVKLLSGEVVTYAEALKRLDAGSSFTYDLSTQAGVDQYRQMNGGMAISWNDQQLIDFAKKGGTIQQLMQMGVITMAPLHGFAEGGAGDFGSGTAVMLHGKEVITPIDKVGNMGGVYLNFNVYGNTVQQTQQVKDIIMRELKTIKQFGAA